MKVDDNINVDNASWTFRGISSDFEKHIGDSVPYYSAGHDLICQYSDFFIKERSVIYDVGASTGLLVRKLAKQHESKNDIRFICIECIDEMVDFAKSKTNDNRIEFLCDDILNVTLEKANLIISYYTMQFIDPNIRQQLINKLF